METEPRQDIVGFLCPACGRKLRAYAAQAGKGVRCPGCGARAEIPRQPQNRASELEVFTRKVAQVQNLRNLRGEAYAELEGIGAKHERRTPFGRALWFLRSIAKNEAIGPDHVEFFDDFVVQAQHVLPQDNSEQSESTRREFDSAVMAARGALQKGTGQKVSALAPEEIWALTNVIAQGIAAEAQANEIKLAATRARDESRAGAPDDGLVDVGRIGTELNEGAEGAPRSTEGVYQSPVALAATGRIKGVPRVPRVRVVLAGLMAWSLLHLILWSCAERPFQLGSTYRLISGDPYFVCYDGFWPLPGEIYFRNNEGRRVFDADPCASLKVYNATEFLFYVGGAWTLFVIFLLLRKKEDAGPNVPIIDGKDGVKSSLGGAEGKEDSMRK